jgi:hypothetical protein
VKHNVLLVVFSLLANLLSIIHLTDDIFRGVSPAGLMNLTAVAFCVLWLYGAMVLTGRRSGYIIVLLCAIFATGIPVLHMAGRGIATASSPFFIWTDLALDVAAVFTVVLAVQGLWSLRSGKPQ